MAETVLLKLNSSWSDTIAKITDFSPIGADELPLVEQFFHSENVNDLLKVTYRHTFPKAPGGMFPFNMRNFLTISDKRISHKGKTIVSSTRWKFNDKRYYVWVWQYDSEIKDYWELSQANVLCGVIDNYKTKPRVFHDIWGWSSEGVNFSNPRVQDLLYPHFVWSGAPMPFTYHRTGTLFMFNVEHLPPSGFIDSYRKMGIYTFHTLQLAGLWFTDNNLAMTCRLTIPHDIPVAHAYSKSP